jgi:endonuclease/exonuclease/phosphatase family metal-dependent hydrolase
MRRALARLLERLPGKRRAPCNHPDPRGPRFAGSHSRRPAADRPLRVVTFNVRFARRVGRAIEAIEESEELRELDVLALQEMDERGVKRIARHLGLDYVYYPAVVHALHGRNFGNAVLSRFRIVDAHKILLPHSGSGEGRLRIAVAATLAVGRRRLRVYNLHLGTPLEIRRRQREEQVAAVLADAMRFRGAVLILGDLNARGVGRLVETRGYHWATKHVRGTIGPFAWDHIFFGGGGAALLGAGVVRDNRGASDHKPVWSLIDLPPAVRQLPA